MFVLEVLCCYHFCMDQVIKSIFESDGLLILQNFLRDLLFGLLFRDSLTKKINRSLLLLLKYIHTAQQRKVVFGIQKVPKEKATKYCQQKVNFKPVLHLSDPNQQNQNFVIYNVNVDFSPIVISWLVFEHALAVIFKIQSCRTVQCKPRQ